MRFVYSMSRLINARRPRKLTIEQSAIANGFLCIVKLHTRTARLSEGRGDDEGEKKYQKAYRRLNNEKQRQRRLLLVNIVVHIKKEQPMKDSERQLAKLVVNEDTLEAS